MPLTSEDRDSSCKPAASSDFEALLADLSAMFVNVPSESLDREIADAQRRVCAFIGVERSSLWLTPAEDDQSLLLTHLHKPEGHPRPPDRMDLSDYFPWLGQQLRSGKIMRIGRIDDLPPEATQDRQTLLRYGAKATLVLPLSAGSGPPIGFLAFTATTKEQDWPELTVTRCRVVAQIFANALMRKRSEDALASRLAFETLLTNLSARFVDLPPEQVDGEIASVQRQLCEVLGLGLSSLWQISAQHAGAMLLTHLHQPQDAPQPPADMDGRVFFPWVMEELYKGRTLVLSSMAQVPPEAVRDLESFALYRVKAALIFPLSAGGGPMFGILTFAALDRERQWPEVVVTRCRLVAQVFANALARKQADCALRASEERYRAITLNLPGLVYQFYAVDDGGWGLYYMDPRAGEVCGVSPEPLATFFTRFTDCIVPEDKEGWLASIRSAVSGLVPWEQEFRFTKPTGEQISLRAASEPRRLGHEVVFYGVIRDVTEQRRAQDQLHRTLEELSRLKEQLQQENVCLRSEVQSLQGQNPIVGNSEALRRVLLQAQQVASTDSTVLILGETGTGKELLAEHIHRIGKRAGKPLVTTNIAAIPSTLLESELFGRERGAYTGALTKQIGRFELADGGTLFLDEIGEMPLETQAKLLRVLQRGEFERLGSGRTLRADVQVIAATNRNLPELIREGKFRQDLYYRLNVFPLTLPPLRERPEDVPSLVWAFVQELSEKMGKPVDRIRSKDLDALQQYNWPGNVRELRNVVERAMILAQGSELRLSLPDAGSGDSLSGSRALHDVERAHIEAVLKSVGGRIRGRNGAAEILNIKPSTLYAQMERLGVNHRK